MSSYIVTCLGHQHALRVHERRPGQYEVELDGRVFSVDCGAGSDNPLSLLIDGRCYEVDVDHSAGAVQQRVTIQRQQFELEVVDARRRRPARQRPVDTSKLQEVRAPMPGSISQVRVSEGDLVTAGQVLMVLDAMKMANELAAPLAGVVGSLAAREGASVNTNELLCVVRPPQLDPT